MKKIFAVMFAVLFLAGSAWAQCNGPACFTDAYPNNHVFSGDHSYVNSYKGSYSNTGKQDEAGAWARGVADSYYGAYSGGNKTWGMVNGAQGFENAGSDSTAGTYAFDFGLTSVAGGFAAQDSFSNGGAIAGGAGLGGWRTGGMAWTETGGFVAGDVHQGNSANEGFGPTGAFAGNQSNAGYFGYTKDSDCDTGSILWGSKSGHDMTGSAFVKGDSFVKVYPYGNFQSSYGKTGNVAMADVNGADYQGTYVNGRGIVNSSAGVGDFNNGGKAAGHSGFVYEGGSFGMGKAEHGSYAQKYGDGLTNSARSGSSGSALTITVGTPNINY